MIKNPKILKMAYFKSNRKEERILLKIFNLLTMYLSLHGLAYPVKFNWKCRNLVLFTVSTTFIIINEINIVYYIFERITSSQNERKDVVFTALLSLEFFLRILFFLTRKKLSYLNHRIRKAYSNVNSQTILKHRTILIFVLLINDIYILFIILAWFSTLKPPQIFCYLGDNYTYGYIKAPESTLLYYVSVSLRMWSYVSPFIVIYFCCFCSALKQTINGLIQKFQKGEYMDITYLDRICTEISNLISDISEGLHDILLLVFIILLGNVFYHTYSIFVEKSMTEFMLFYRILNIIICFFRFVAICTFSSSVSKAGSELKRIIYNLKFKINDRWMYFRLIAKINDKFVEFKLLDNIKLDKSLILASVGTMVTYGIIIATFNTNSQM